MSESWPVVFTTIQPPTQALKTFADLGHPCIIIGDRKTPKAPEFSLKGFTYFDLKAQVSMPYYLRERLPENHYTRKNLGYLHAMHSGCELLGESDDDNLPMDSWGRMMREPENLLQPTHAGTAAAINVYRYFTDKRIWPRGFPLTCVRTEVPELEVSQTDLDSVLVVQGLANGEPDVDAIHRLVYGENLTEFNVNQSIVLEKGAWCPFNSQNTLWRKAAFPYLYLPFTVSFRMTDILRSFVAQRGIWELGGKVVHTRATVTQDRNPHYLLHDFAEEVPVYLRTEEILEALWKLPLKGDAGEDIRAMYQQLHDMAIVETAELEGLRAWLQDLANIGGIL